jgi:tyrosyl-tRNA synthetase
LTVPILVGTDGKRKMSKSLGNYVGITESPGEMFGKLMSIPDELMWSYYELCTDLPSGDIEKFQQAVNAGKLHPMDAKMELARLIVSEFHGEDAAKKARGTFQRVFRDRQSPDAAPARKLPAGAPKRLVTLLVELSLAPSRSEAERLVKQGGVEIDGNRVADVKKEVDLSRPYEFLLRAGKKKFLRVVVE